MQRVRHTPKIVLLAASLLILLLVVSGVAWFARSQQAKTTVTVNIAGASDGLGLRGQLDDQPIALNYPRTTLTLKAGQHALTVTKPGYQTFSTPFTISRGEEVTVNASLSRTPPPDLQNLNDISDKIPANKWKLTAIRYFGTKDWALASAQLADGTPASFILHYDDSASAWRNKFGPFTILYEDDVVDFPGDLQQYLRSNNYVNEG